MEAAAKFPVIFFGHGSPMSAIENNCYTQGWVEVVKNISAPKAILAISAHWESDGVKITANQKQKTIHDFYGFPKELFDVQYQALGDLDLAREIQKIAPEVQFDNSWGLDHGTWSILKHTHPNADIPVLQLSLDRDKTPLQHYEFAQKLQILRDEKILIIGSGNIVHNLRMLDWSGNATYWWAQKFNQRIVKAVLENDHETIINFVNLEGSKQSAPTSEHFLPLLYILGLRQEGEGAKVFNDAIELGSIGMASFLIE